VWTLVFVLLGVSSAMAIDSPEQSALRGKEFRHPDLTIERSFRVPAELALDSAIKAGTDLAALGAPADSARLDVRSGRWAAITPAAPLVPGPGVGNTLSWQSLGRGAPTDGAELEAAVAEAFRGYLEANAQALRLDPAEVRGVARITTHENGLVAQVYHERSVNGVRVRGSYLTAVLNSGNLVLFGAEKWGDIDVSTVPTIDEADALVLVQSHVEPSRIVAAWGKNELILVPLASGSRATVASFGHGYRYRLAHLLRPAFDNDLGHWEALVDAHTGELISFEDTNQYATAREVKGGVYPVSNDGTPPDGVEQANWPMPFADVTNAGKTYTTDGGGNLLQCVEGNVTSTLTGQYVNIFDNCGAISRTSGGDINFGTSGGDDCTTPGFGGAGNTHSSRTGFHELNRIVEMAQSHLPGNSWLQQQLTANMNINQNCNAFWGGGTVNFYRSGGGCFNTGEIAGVFDHEWGHGMDDNDAVPSIASPSGEGVADIYAALRLNDSCIGRGFRASDCGGFGDPCLACTGVRDIDYLKRASGNPHTYSWSNTNCGGSVHCVGAVYAEAVWSLWKRKLQSAPYNLDNNTAHEVVNRLSFIGAGNTGTWFSGGPPNGGCSGASGYMNYLAADDDNGNLSDGTPHMTAIYEAFNDQEIACATPTVQDSGCAGGPTTAPVVSATALDRGASLSWGAVAGATSYEIFRTDGVFACDFGKTRVGETTGTSYVEFGLQNGRDYSYVVIAKGTAGSCFGPASSCTAVTPVGGANFDVDAASLDVTINTGDGDGFVDNCEQATVTFDITNIGTGSLTNLRIDDVRVVSHPSISVSGSSVTSPTLAACQTTSGSFGFTGKSLSFGDSIVFEVDVTSDQLSPVVKTQTLTVSNAESDLQSMASKTWDFESDLDGWTLIQGTFNQTTSGGGANGSAGYTASSANLDDQCDQVRSPAFRPTAATTLSAWTNFDIEANSGQWWDQANFGVFEAGGRNIVDPDGGRLYNADGDSELGRDCRQGCPD
jgi:hypothetical protein